MRWTRALVLIAILALLAACGGGGAGESAGDDGDGDGNGTSQSQPAEASAAPPPDDDDDDGNGGPSSAGDLEELMDSFEPPNSTEVTRTSGTGFLFVIFTSTDDAESLADFYEDKIADAGFETVSRSETEGVYSWIFGEGSDSSFGGVVGVGPSTDGGPGSSVSIQLGSGS
jgi:hypothetical protein